MNDDGSGVIYEILERKNHLSRKAIKTRGASYRGERLEQVIAANIDNIFIVTSTIDPDFNNKTLDRFLVACESSHINTFIIINKTDLAEEITLKSWADLYKNIGYNVLLTSAMNLTGLEELFHSLKGKKNLFLGSIRCWEINFIKSAVPSLKAKSW